MIGGKFSELNDKEKAMLCNGCGAKGGLNVPDLCFTESCNEHDYDYFMGKTIKDKNKADLNFLKRNIKLSWKKPLSLTYGITMYLFVRFHPKGKEAFFKGKASL